MRLGPMGPWAATPHLLPALPFTPGKDGAGTIEAVGTGVDESRFRGKNRVYTLVPHMRTHNHTYIRI